MAKIIGECHFIGCIMQEKCAFEWDLQSGREDEHWEKKNNQITQNPMY